MQNVPKIAKNDIFYANVVKPRHPVKYDENMKIQKNHFFCEILAIFYCPKILIKNRAGRERKNPSAG